MPGLADGGGSDEGRDWEEGEDVPRQVRAKRAKFCHFGESDTETQKTERRGRW